MQVSRLALLITAAMAALGSRAVAQLSQPAQIATPVNALRSPEVHSDRTVTLRFYAPQATEIDLVGEINLGKGPQRMTKGEDGIWSITTSPLAPEIWSYSFRVQGVEVPDPSNPSIKPVPPGFPMASFVEVPGETPAIYDSRSVPHGEVRIVTYESKAMGVTRLIWVYTPPGYDKNSAKYPVLYLLHGNGEAQNGWIMNGRANLILDNLIAEKKAQPMLVVMPQGHALQGAAVGPLVRIPGETTMYSERFPKDLIEDVIPLVERNYRVLADADHRAIAGLSMGGGQALSTGLAHMDLFHYVLGYSSAVGAPFMNPNEAFRDFLAHASVANSKLRLLWIGCGKQDFLYEANRKFVETLAANNVKLTYRETEGAHVWSVWRKYLAESVPLLFAGRR